MLSICIKRTPRRDENQKTSLKAFVSSYMNKFYIELNGILRDYRSLREHGHRNSMLEFATTKVRDMELFLMVISGAYLQHNLRVTTLKKYDYMEQGSHIINMADFIAVMFENMKTSFVPKHDFALALQVAVDPSKLLPDFHGLHGPRNTRNRLLVEEGVDSSESELVGNEEQPSKPDFEEIDRLIKIYLLEEDVSNCTIGGGKLTLHSAYMTLEVALCGDYSAPSWMLVSAKTVFEEPDIERLLVGKLPKTLRGIIAFRAFYEARRLAHDVFSNLKEEISGFYQNFTGKVLNYAIQGQIKESNFICDAKTSDKTFRFVNKSYAVISNVLRGAETREVSVETKCNLYTVDYKKDMFGENITFFFSNVYLCFPRMRMLFHIGDRETYSTYRTVELNWNEDRLVGCIHSDMNRHAVPSEGVPISTRKIFDFVRRNEKYFLILHAILPLAEELLLDGGITVPFCSIFDGYSITQLSQKEPVDDQSQNWSYSNTDPIEIIGKARLLYLQINPPEGFNILENIKGGKFILEIHNIQVLVSSNLKTALKYLTEDCKHFNLVDGLEYIRKFGALYKYNILPSSWALDRVIIDLSGLTGEIVTIEKAVDGFRISGQNTLRMLNIDKIFSEENVHTIGALHKAFIVNRFFYVKNLYPQGVIDKNTVELPNGCRISLTSNGLNYILSNGAVNSEYSRMLNLSRSIIDCLKSLFAE